MMNELIIAGLEGRTDANGKKYSVAELARRAHLTRAGLYRILNGEVMPAVDTAIRISRYISELYHAEITVEELWHVM